MILRIVELLKILQQSVIYLDFFNQNFFFCQAVGNTIWKQLHKYYKLNPIISRLRDINNPKQFHNHYKPNLTIGRNKYERKNTHT